ncbi:MAG: ABC transporter ATP-binding protein [Lachnospiraceae bacterium]|nr:ABC transporter ATP-binding protein [Lachnospiraceae bacterium]
METSAEETKIPYIKCDGLVRIFKSEGIEVMALQGLDLEIRKGELAAIIGKSGSGKSTLLNLLGCLDRPSAGFVAYDGVNMSELSDKELAAFRNRHIGFVWQKNTDNLLNYLTVAENIEMPLMFTRLTHREKRERTRRLLEAVGLADKEKAFPYMLSGGEQQRVAIATALINEPELLLMDEPTGAVDRKTSIMLQDLFRELNRKLGITVIIVTHDISLADRVDRVVMISDGKISSERILKEEYKKRIEEGETMLREGGTPDFAAAGEEAAETDSHEEFSILDKAGRVRLSAEMRQAAGITSNRVKIDLVDGKIVITGEED